MFANGCNWSVVGLSPPGSSHLYSSNAKKEYPLFKYTLVYFITKSITTHNKTLYLIGHHIHLCVQHVLDRHRFKKWTNKIRIQYPEMCKEKRAAVMADEKESDPKK